MNLGIIGTNFISDELIDAATQISGFAVHSIYSRKMATGREFGAKYGITRVFDDLNAFLSDPELNAVYIASPNARHCPQAIAAMEHGKHVLVEKPAASNLREWTAMTAAAERNHVVLMEAMRVAYLPGYQWIIDQLHRIGPVRSAQFQFCQYSRRYDRYKAGEVMNTFDPSLSNAAVMDIGVYVLHIFLKLFGTPDAVSAASVLLPNGMEGTGTAIFSYPDMIGSLTWSKITDGAAPSVIQGENGCITIDHLTRLKRVTLTLRDGETDTYLYDGPQNSMHYELEVFRSLADAAAENKLDLSSIFNATETCIRVMDEIRRQTKVIFPADNT